MNDQAHKSAAPIPEPPKAPLRLDSETRGLLKRVIRDWVLPRKSELAVAFVLMAALAAVTGFYPRLIKHAFDVLPRAKEELGLLYGVAGMIILATTTRALLMYLTNIKSNGIVMRVTVDMQKAGIAHLLKADYARLTRDAPGELISRLTNDIDRSRLRCRRRLRLRCAML